MLDLPAKRENECTEDYFTRMVEAKGWFELSPLELLALEVFEDLKAEAEGAAQELREMEDERDAYASETDDLRNENYELREVVDDLREEVTSLEGAAEDSGYTSDETTQDDEVEFLKTLVRDLEDELAAIEAGVPA